MNGQSVCVLLVEDDSIDAQLARWALAANAKPPFVVESAATMAQAIERIGNETFDVVLLDLGLPDSLRSETLARFRKACRQEIPIVVLTDQMDEQSAFELLNCGRRIASTKTT